MFSAAVGRKAATFWQLFEISFDLVKIRIKNKRFGASVSHNTMFK